MTNPIIQLKKISDLDPAGAVDNADLVPIVQAGKTTHTTVGDLPISTAQLDALNLKTNIADLASTAAGKGSALIAFKANGSGALNRTVQDVLRSRIRIADYGSSGFNPANSAAANNEAFAAAYAEAVARGGAELTIDEGGTYNLSATWVITASGVSVVGQSRQAILLDFAASTSGDGIEFRGADFFRCIGVNVRNAFRHGISVTQNAADNPSRGEISHCVALACGSSGFYSEDGFLIRYNNCRAQSNSGYGFLFDGYHTTVHAIACQGQTNSLGGWKINDMTYSTFESCGADTNTGPGWAIQNVHAVAMIGCGAESNTGEGWLLQASSSIATGAVAPDIKGLSLKSCFAYNNDGGGTKANFLNIVGHTANTNRINVEVDNCVDKTAAGPSVRVRGNVRYLSRRNQFVGAETIETFAVKQVYPQNDQNPFGKSITAANTPLFTLTDLLGNTTHYSGLLMVTARSAKWPDNLGQSASYVLHVCKGATGSAVNVVNSAGATTGGAANHPSFTWTLDTVNNELEASPVASTVGTFYFNVVPVGDLIPTFA